MTTLETLRTDLTTAMKASDRPKVDALRMMITAVVSASKQGTEQDPVPVLIRYRNQVIESLETAQGETAEKLRQELGIVESYLPKEPSEDEVRVFLAAITGNFADRMKSARTAFPTFDGKKLASMAKE